MVFKWVFSNTLRYETLINIYHDELVSTKLFQAEVIKTWKIQKRTQLGSLQNLLWRDKKFEAKCKDTRERKKVNYVRHLFRIFKLHERSFPTSWNMRELLNQGYSNQATVLTSHNAYLTPHSIHKENIRQERN